MKLVIAEKPSVAFSIAKALGTAKAQNGYIEGKDYLFTWCVGHLITLESPAAYDEKFTRWNIADLPIFPEQFKYTIYGDKTGQFKTIKSLMKRKDIDGIVNACDAGREGELIFRLVYQEANCKKPVMRLWISSMEKSAICKGFENLKAGGSYDNLYQSALCRLWADWLVGINASRLYSLLYGKTLNIGRVQTPTLAFLVERQKQIDAFQKEKYYTVSLNLDSGKAESNRIDSLGAAESLKTACEQSQAVCVSVEKKPKQEQPPKLFDLTALQKQANKTLGYTAKQTLDYAQFLYEKKLITYPRTDSQFLTEDMTETITAILGLAGKMQSLEVVQDRFANIPRLINNDRVTDHHAIIPTKEINRADLSTLPESEQKLLKLIVCRLLSAVAEPYVYNLITVQFDCASTVFTLKEKEIVFLGYKEIEYLLFPSSGIKPPGTTSNFQEGQTYINLATTLTEKYTTAPSAYTESTLLSAMENAGKKETSAGVERKGLGTPATRAGIIEKLIKAGFVERKAKQLIPTQNGMFLISVLPDTLTSPDMTAEWENYLLDIANGNAITADFMNNIKAMLTELITNPKQNQRQKDKQEVV